MGNTVNIIDTFVVVDKGFLDRGNFAVKDYNSPSNISQYALNKAEAYYKEKLSELSESSLNNNADLREKLADIAILQTAFKFQREGDPRVADSSNNTEYLSYAEARKFETLKNSFGGSYVPPHDSAPPSPNRIP